MCPLSGVGMPAIKTPLWNFGMPAILKACLDQVLMPNVTFTIGGSVVKGLHHIRKVVVMAASGGAYEPGDPRDGIRNGLKVALGFVGITDLEVAWSQGQAPLFSRIALIESTNNERPGNNLIST